MDKSYSNRNKTSQVILDKNREYYLKNRERILKKRKEYADAHKEEKKLYDSEYREKNKVRISKRRKLYRESTKEHKRLYDIEYRKKNSKILKLKKQEYQQKNKGKLSRYYRKWKNTNYKTNINYRLSEVLRSRIRMAVKNQAKVGSSVKDLGCSINKFKQYIELKFQDGMNWKNYGEWHLDHIKPLSSFDLTDRSQFLEACHYTNYQPLWAIDNIKKGDKIL